METSTLCQHCDGECCKGFLGQGISIWGDDMNHQDELQAVPDPHDPDDLRVPILENGDCIHLTMDYKCAVQHIKPTYCKGFLCDPAEAFNGGTPLETCLIMLKEQRRICG